MSKVKPASSAKGKKEQTQEDTSSRSEAMQQKLLQFLYTMSDDLFKKNKQKAQHTFQQFQNTYAKYETAYKTNTYPKCLLSITIEISETLEDISKKQKQYAKLTSEWTAFLEPFKAILDAWKVNPQRQAEADNDLSTSNTDDNKSSSKGKKKDVSDEDFQSLGEKLIRECNKARTKDQKPNVSVNKLYKVINALKAEEDHDKQLVNSLINEACTILADDKPTSPLTKGQWEIAFEVVNQFKKNDVLVIPILRRLNREFVERERSSNKDSIESDEILKLKPRFISLMRDTMSNIKENEDIERVSVLDMLIEQNYSNPEVDLIDDSIHLFNSMEKSGQSKKPLMVSMKKKVQVYLAYNLAIRNHPIEASDIYSLIANISDEPPIVKTYHCRTRAMIGLVAFKAELYDLALKSLDIFYKKSQIPKQLGQAPMVVEPWLVLDPYQITIFRLLSKSILDIQSNLNEKHFTISVFSNLFQTTQQILNDSTKNNISIPEKCLADIKNLVTVSFLLSSSEAPDEIAIDYLKKNFGVELPQIQALTEEVRKFKDGAECNLFLTPNKTEVDPSLADKIEEFKKIVK